jgi:hypothetical protein
MNLSDVIFTDRVKPDGNTLEVAAGQGNINSDIVATADCDGLRFLIGFGAITAGAATSVKLQQGNDGAALADAADVAGSAVVVADTEDGKVVVIDVFQPQFDYMRVVTLRATQNAAVDFVIVEKYGRRKLPAPAGSNLDASSPVILQSP